MFPRPPLGRYNDWMLLLLRISLGSTFIVHGLMKWKGFDVPPENIMDVVIKLLAVVEPIGGAMVIIGVGFELALFVFAIVMVGALYTKMMLGAVFVGRISWEFELLLLTTCLAFLSIGPGKFALDSLCIDEPKRWWQFWKR